MNLLLALAVAALSPQGASGDTLDNHPELKLALSQSQRQIQSVDGSFSGAQPGRYQFGLAASGRLTVGDLTIRTVAYGNGSEAIATARPSSALGKDELGYSKLTFSRPGISEWYVNEAEGLHHWFQVDRKVGEGNLWVKLATSGAKGAQVSGNKIDFATSQGNLSYAGLKVWDATGKQLPASMQLRGSELVIGIKDESATYPVTIDPTWTEEAILSASDKSEFANFGWSVSVSGDTAIVGALNPAAPDGIDHAGAAYVFTRTGSTWSEQQILSASDKSGGAAFGCCVSVSGDTAVITAPSAYSGGVPYAGQAYVFSRNGSTWSQQQILSASDKSANGSFGLSVSVSGDTVVIGGPSARSGGVAYGQAYVFTRNGSTWSEQAILSASEKSEYFNFGYSVSVSGDTAVVGAPQADPGAVFNAGAAYVFTRNGSTWSEQAILSASDKSQNGSFGNVVSASGDTVVIGAPLARVGGVAHGQAYVFTRNGSTWSEQQILSASDKSGGAEFGSSVSVSGDTAIIGAPWKTYGGMADAGQAYVFTRSGSTWCEQAILSASDKSQDAIFGVSVSVSGDTAIVTARYANSGEVSYAGQAYVYRTSSSSSIQASVSFAAAGVTGGKSMTGTVTLASAQSANTVVCLSSNNAALGVPASVTIAAGSTTAQFTATSSVVTSDTLVTVTASGTGITAGSGQLTVRTPRVGAVTLTADFVTEGQPATGTVTLQSPAPAGGTLVTLINGNSDALDCPATVTVPAGQSRVTFTVTGKFVTVATTIKVEGTPSFGGKFDTITVIPIRLQEVSVPDFAAGFTGQGRVTLSAPAPAGGILVSLSSGSVKVSVPTTVLVPKGASTASFSVSSTGPVLNVPVIATCRAVTTTDTVSVVALNIATVTSSLSSIGVGGTTTITVTLNAVTPQDLPITISLQKAGVVSAPVQLVIPAGSNSGSFQVTGLATGVTNVYVRLLSQGTKSAKITVINP